MREGELGPATAIVATGLAAPEGPVLAAGDWILNVCSLDRPSATTRGGDIVGTRWGRPETRTVVFNTSTDARPGIPASLAFGPDKALYVADEGRRAILRVGNDRAQEEWVGGENGPALNGPNDLSFDSNGALFFTDPWTSSAANPVGAVYGFSADGKLTKIDDGMAFPNGIVVRDGRLLVAETYRNCIWAYDVVGAGRAINKRLFCTLPEVPDAAFHGPDGMAFDSNGNLYVAHYGAFCVRVFASDGELLRSIMTQGNPTNVCFGGPRFEHLVATIDDRGELHAYDIGALGDRINYCPSADPTHAWRVG
jgi:sugar lactone lactonase YvrE